MKPPLAVPLLALAASLTANFELADLNPAQEEDQLKTPVQQLLKTAGELLALEVETRTEALSAPGVRPDIGVTVGKLPTGHVELKAPGKGARPEAFASRHDRDQFKRLADHPNLLYTDGNEWALYRTGSRVGAVVRAAGDVRFDGPAAYEDAQAVALELLLRDFLTWEPIVPTTPRALAQMLAPLTRLLRDACREALETGDSAIATLADEWRRYFFPDADDARFADAYAQTLTYALLLARVEGEVDLRHHAADRLDARHELLAQVLRVLAQPAARQEVEVPVSLLERVVEAVDPGELARRARGHDIWLYFYEDFLAAYDPKLRKQSGVYYTPAEVVQAQVRLVSELLRERFDLESALAEPGVVVLDPAVGTGTYLLAALEAGAETAERAFGPAARAELASVMAENLYGFELLVGPYAVAQLRVAQRVLAFEGQLPEDGLRIYLADTLESPHASAPHLAHAPLFEKRLAEENERARRVKAETDVLVCLGNPPYFRQVIAPDEEDVERMGGWVRYGSDGETGILDDFLREAPGVHAKNLYNLYVYFWRFALWKVFESGRRRGIVTFITASSYLRGPGFAGMRRHMRELFEELWILDLGGEGRGARTSENVFAIQTPVAIAIGYRLAETRSDEPARVRYARVDGTRAEKLRTLHGISTLDDLSWSECFGGWTQPFLPEGQGDFFSWPALTDLFPWQHTGCEWQRTWPIAPRGATLVERWRGLMQSDARGVLFRETRDRRINTSYLGVIGDSRLPPVGGLPPETPPPAQFRYGFRCLDRQWCLADGRLGDFLRPSIYGERAEQSSFG